MKRFLIGFMMIGLVAGSVATAEAKQPHRKKVERTVVGSYTPYPAPVTGCNAPLGSFACLIVPTRTTERFVTVKVTDTHGQPVYFEVSSAGISAGFCGKTARPVAIRPGSDLEVDVGLPRWGFQTQCPASSVKTTGTIRVMLSNLP